MKIVFTFICLICLSVTAAIAAVTPVEHTFEPFVTIFKPFESSGIQVEFENNTYYTAYNKSEKKFDNISAPFNVVSPIIYGVTSYVLTLEHNIQYCNEEPLVDTSGNPAVVISIDNEVLNEKESLPSISFSATDVGTVNKRKSHELSFSFPVIEQDSVQIDCKGFVGLVVEGQI